MSAFQVVQVCPRGYVHAQALTEMAEGVYFGLRRLGITVFYQGTPTCAARQIVIGGHLLEARELRELAPDAIVYNSEQVTARWVRGWYLPAILNRTVWDYSSENVRLLRQLGVRDVRCVPIGYVPELARIAARTEDIDVLFYGSMNTRRRHVLDALKARGLKVTELFGVYGEERDREIARASVVLNLHFYPAKIFEVVRVSYLLANGKAVVSECGPDTSMEPDLREALCAVPYERLVEACLELVGDPLKRQALGERARSIFARRRQEDYLASALSTAPPS